MSIDGTYTEYRSLNKSSNSSSSSNILRFMRKHQIANYHQPLKKSVENIEWYWNAVNKDLGLEWYYDYYHVYNIWLYRRLHHPDPNAKC